jgi:hypothetical protein
MKKDARLQCGPTRATSTGKPGLCWRRILLQCLSRSAPAAEAAAQAAAEVDGRAEEEAQEAGAEVDGRAEEEAQEAGARVEAARVEPVARAGKAELEARAELVAQAGQAARVELEARAELPDAAAVESRIPISTIQTAYLRSRERLFRNSLRQHLQISRFWRPLRREPADSPSSTPMIFWED